MGILNFWPQCKKCMLIKIAIFKNIKRWEICFTFLYYLEPRDPLFIQCTILKLRVLVVYQEINKWFKENTKYCNYHNYMRFDEMVRLHLICYVAILEDLNLFFFFFNTVCFILISLLKFTLVLPTWLFEPLNFFVQIMSWFIRILVSFHF